MRRHVRITLGALGAAMLLSACAVSSTPADPRASSAAVPPPVDSASSPLVAPSTPTATSSTLAAGRCSGPSVVLLHQAPELEAVLPPSVDGRPLSRWSV